MRRWWNQHNQTNWWRNFYSFENLKVLVEFAWWSWILPWHYSGNYATDETACGCSESLYQRLLYDNAWAMLITRYKISWKNFLRENFFLKIDDRFFTKIWFLHVALLSIENLLNFPPLLLKWLFLKKMWFLKRSDLCFLTFWKIIWF